MIYQIPVDQITGLAKYGLALSCTAVSDLAESDLARYAPPNHSAKVEDQKFLDMTDQHMNVNGEGHLQASLPFKAGLEALLCLITVELSS